MISELARTSASGSVCKTLNGAGSSQASRRSVNSFSFPRAFSASLSTQCDLIDSSDHSTTTRRGVVERLVDVDDVRVPDLELGLVAPDAAGPGLRAASASATASRDVGARIADEHVDRRRCGAWSCRRAACDHNGPPAQIPLQVCSSILARNCGWSAVGGAWPAAHVRRAHRAAPSILVHLQRGDEGLLGISTWPNWRIFFLPFFCLSSSLRLRVMSPP